MANISLTIPDASVNRILNAIATKYGYTGFLANGTTPQTKAEFTKEQIKKFLISAVKDQEGNTIIQTALRNNDSDVDTNIPIT